MPINTIIIQIINEISPIGNIKLTQDGFEVGDDLLKVSNSELQAPISLQQKFHQHLSPLDDDLSNLSQLSTFVQKFKNSNTMISLNHIGLCYKVDSLDLEKKQLLIDAKNSGYDLFQERTDNADNWMFMGDLQDWQNPLIECVPVVSANDSWVKFWLPHIHIDVDTNAEAEKINNLANEVFDFNNKPSPFYAVVENSTVYVVRIRLGLVDGVNIMLDLATSKRQPKFQRTQLLKKFA